MSREPGRHSLFADHLTTLITSQPGIGQSSSSARVSTVILVQAVVRHVAMPSTSTFSAAEPASYPVHQPSVPGLRLVAGIENAEMVRHWQIAIWIIDGVIWAAIWFCGFWLGLFFWHIIIL